MNGGRPAAPVHPSAACPFAAPEGARFEAASRGGRRPSHARNGSPAPGSPRASSPGSVQRLAGDQRSEARAFDRLAGVVEQLPIAIARLEDADDIRMRRLRQRRRLAAQRTPALLAGVVPCQHRLERDDTVEHRLPGPVLRDAGGGPSQIFEDLEARDDRSSRLVHVRWRQRRRNGRRRSEIARFQVEQRQNIRGSAAVGTARDRQGTVVVAGGLPEVTLCAAKQLQVRNRSRLRGLRVRHHQQRSPDAVRIEANGRLSHAGSGGQGLRQEGMQFRGPNRNQVKPDHAIRPEGPILSAQAAGLEKGPHSLGPVGAVRRIPF